MGAEIALCRQGGGELSVASSGQHRTFHSFRSRRRHLHFFGGSFLRRTSTHHSQTSEEHQQYVTVGFSSVQEHMLGFCGLGLERKGAQTWDEFAIGEGPLSIMAQVNVADFRRDTCKSDAGSFRISDEYSE